MDSSDLRKLIIGAVVGLIVGLLLGMVLFWGLFPVEWENARSYDLAPEERAVYLALVADSFELDKDRVRAEQYLKDWNSEEKEAAVADALDVYTESGQADKVQAVTDMAMALRIPVTASATPPPPELESPTGNLWSTFRVPCLVFVLALLVLVLALIGIRAYLKRRDTASPPVAEREYTASTVARTEAMTGGDDAPLGHFVTTYQLGEDTYDESFTIEAPTGEFLGECGMGISQTIGEGEPDKVTAFEVWLFDKSDIRTVTKVLMSQHAFEDEALRAKLAPKGEAVLAQPGSPIALETSSLGVRVDVSDLAYGTADLPADSFFSKLMVELVAVAKPAEAESNPF